jgi:hypothetical protein
MAGCRWGPYCSTAPHRWTSLGANSIHLLAKLGFRFERMARLSEEAPEVKLFAAEV